MSGASQSLFQAFRTPEIGWDLIVNQNAFIEQVLPNSIVRTLSDAEMEQYRTHLRIQPIVNLCGNFQTNFRLR